MKMMRIVHVAVVGALMGGASFAWAVDGKESEPAEVVAPTQQAVPAQSGKWESAGREVQDAAGAVAEATRESTGTAWDAIKSGSAEMWDKTKSGSQELYHTAGERSKEAWHATKEESQDLWHKGKALIHEATAPEPAAAPPAATAPVEPVAPPPSTAPPAQ